MGDPTDDSYILIEDSHNLDDGDMDQKQGDVHDKSEAASERTLGLQGVYIKSVTQTTETTEPSEDLFKKLLDQGGIEILPNSEDEGPDL